MTKKDEILRELLNGASLKEIQKKFNDPKASLYEAYMEYFPIAIPEIEKKQRQLSDLDLQINERQGRVEALNTEISKLNQWKDRAEKDKTSLQENLLDLEKTLRDKNEIFHEIDAKLSDLKKRGISSELVTQISEMDVKTGVNLLARVKTAEAYNEFIERKKDLENTVDSLERNKAKAEKDLDKLKEDAAFQRNELDAEKEKTRMYRGAVEITDGFLKDGYSIPDLKALRKALEAIRLKGEPTASLNRLITGLQNMKTLNRINDEIDGKTSELNVLNSNISKAQGALNGYQQILIDTLAETNQKMLNGIQAWEKRVENQLVEVGKNYLQQIMKFDGNVKTCFGDAEKSMKTNMRYMALQVEAMQRQIQEMGEAASGITSHLDEKTLDAAKNLREELSFIAKDFKSTWEGYNDLKDKIRDYEVLQRQGLYFLGIVDKFDAEKIPIPILIQILDRIKLYIELKFPGKAVYPKNSTTLTGFSSMTGYKLSSTVDVLKQGLTEQWRETDERKA
ncbi:MAG: hypothetical protein V1850_00190 [Candidatus Bathyarchaeota archaeon]